MDKRLQSYLDNPDVPVGEELAPLVDVARRLQNAPRPTLNSAAKARIEARLTTPNVVSFKRNTARRLLFRAVAAILVVVFFVGSGSAWASEDSLPGDTLYPVKRFVENTRLALATSESAETDLRLEFAQRRLNEFDQLLDKNIVDLAVLQDVNEDISYIQGLSPSDATRLDLVALTQKQQTLLMKAQTIRPQNTAIQTLSSDNDERLLNLRLPDLTVCDFEFWEAQPGLWRDVVITLNGVTLDQATIVSGQSDRLFEQYISMKLDVLVNNRTESELLMTAEQVLTGMSNEFTSEEMAAILADACNSQQAPSAEDVSVDSTNSTNGDDSGNNSSTTNPSSSEGIDCNNPPPPHAPAVGWRERCGTPGPEPGNNGNRQGNNDNRSNNGRGNGQDKDKE